jgi:hypothetical protein
MRLRWLPIAAMALAFARPALAEPTDADRATARALAEEGAAALDAKKYDVAADRFARADQLVHAPTLLLALAQAEVGLGKYVEAQENYLRIMREGVPAGAPPAWKRAVETAQEEVKAIAPKLAWVTVTVAGADSFNTTVDGTLFPKAALGIKRAVNPGDHLVKVQADGYKPAEASFKVGPGDATALELRLQALPKSLVPAAEPAKGAQPAPVATTGADVGTSKSSQKVVGFVALGVGGAGLVVGSIAGALAMGKKSSLDSSCANGKCPDQAPIDSYRSVATVSTVGFVVGVVGAGAGAILLITAPPSTEHASVQPYIGLASAGAKVSF